MIYTYFQKNLLQYIACSLLHTCILCQNCHDLNKKKLYNGDVKSLDLLPKLRFRLVDIFISVHTTKAQSTKEKNKLIVSPYFTLSLSTYIKNISVFRLRTLTYIHFNTYFYQKSVEQSYWICMTLDTSHCLTDVF